jgi:hypothetical protein
MLHGVQEMLFEMRETIPEQFAGALTNRALGRIVQHVRHAVQNTQVRFLPFASHNTIQRYQYKLGTFYAGYALSAAVSSLNLLDVFGYHGDKIKTLAELQETLPAHHRYDIVRKTFFGRKIFRTATLSNVLFAPMVPECLTPTSEKNGLHLVLRLVGSSKIYHEHI